MSLVTLWFTVLLQVAMAIYLMGRLGHIAHMRDEVPNHKDTGLHKGIDIAIHVAWFILIPVLSGALLISGKPEQITVIFYEVALGGGNVAVILLFAALAACRGTSAEPKGGGIHYGPGYGISGKHWVYTERGESVLLGPDWFFYGALRTKRETTIMRDGSSLIVKVSFLPNPDAPKFLETSPSFYDKEVDRGFKQFLDKLAVLDDPTDDRIREFASNFAFPDLVIAKVESLKPGRELLKTSPSTTES